jgi:arylsulfatase
VPAFAQDGSVKHDFLWWLHEGSRAIRVGDWKLVAAAPSLRGRLGQPGPRDQVGDWELYHLGEDPTETQNLAAQMPEKVRELATLWTALQDDFFRTARQGLAAP